MSPLVRGYGWKVSRPFPSLTTWCQSRYSLGHAVLQVIGQAGASGSVANFGGLGVQAAPPPGRITGTNARTTVTHLSPTLLERGRSRLRRWAATSAAPGRFNDDEARSRGCCARLVGGGVEQLPDRGLTGSWLSKSASGPPSPDHLERHGTSQLRSIKAWSVESCERPHPQRRRSHLLAHAAKVGTGRLVTAGPRQQACRLTALIGFEEGVVHAAPALFPGRLPARCLATINRQEHCGWPRPFGLKTRH